MKTKVLIVSSDEKLLAEIRLVHDKLLDFIDFSFASTEDEAKRQLYSAEFSLVCSEYFYDNINGVELLSFVREKFPKTFRLLFTEQSKRERAIYTSTDTHRFINKPLTNGEYENALKHFLSLLNYNLDSKTVAALNGIGQIPTMPEVYIRLEREVNRSEVSISRIADIISNDPLVAAKIMHIVYSSFYNISKSIVNLVHAINFLGLDIIKSLVLYIKVFVLKNQPPEVHSFLKKVRDHSIDVAKVSKAIMNFEFAKREHIDLAYIAGLLHDIGKIVLIQCSDKLKRLEFAIEHQHGVLQIEKEENQFGVNHINAGSFLLLGWNFPEEIIDAIANHHNPEIVKNGELGLSQVVYIANTLLNGEENKIDELKNIYGPEKVESWFEFIPGQLEEK